MPSRESQKASRPVQHNTTVVRMLHRYVSAPQFALPVLNCASCLPRISGYLTPTCPAATAEAEEGAGEVILEAPGVQSVNQSMIEYLSDFRNTLRYLLTFRCSLFLFSFPFFCVVCLLRRNQREERLRCQRIFDLPEGWVRTGLAYSQNVPCETKRYCSVFA